MPERDMTGVRIALLNGGIAPKYVRRALSELQAHFLALCAEAQERGFTGAAATAYAEAKMGTDKALVDAYCAQPKLKSWGARRPGIAFTIVPVLLFLASFAVSLFLVVIAATIAKRLAVPAHDARILAPWLPHAAIAVRVAILHGVPLAVSLVIAAYAMRRRLPPVWPTVGIVLVALLAATTTVDIVLPQPGYGGLLSAGFGLNTSAKGVSGMMVRLLPAALVALAPILWGRRSAAI